MEYDKRIEIRYLLDAWFEGETTGEQERRLKEYFLSAEDVPSDLLYAKAMFAGFAEAAEEECGRLPEFGSEKVFVYDAPEAEITVIAAPTSSSHGTGSLPVAGRRRMIYTAISVAASLVIALGVTLMLIPDNKPTVYCYMNGEPVTDIDVATRQAQMAARLLEGSAKASAEGIAKVSEASKPMEKLGQTLRMLGVAE